MADDAATPEGELSESKTETSPTSPSDTADGVSESPEQTTTATEHEATATEPESTGKETDTADYNSEAGSSDETDEEDDEEAEPVRTRRLISAGAAVVISLLLVVALAGLVGWLTYETIQSHRADEQRNLFLQVGRQGAVNLTTIDYEHADADVQRILDSATGQFYDDFSKRSQPFVDVVKQAKSKSEGTVTEAGLERPETANEGQVLVAVAVKTSNAGAPDQQPRAWRMRITVQKVGDGAKVSNVEFVP
jgi:Mce-associated membrane protein